MNRMTAAFLTLAYLALPLSAKADNPLSTDQLLRALQVATADYTANDPEMAKSISGLKTSTSGSNAVVTVEMNADGMKMTAKYLCVPRASEMACRFQQ